MKNQIEAPEELKSKNFWINWKLDNTIKKPCSPSGANVDVTDPQNWLSYEKAVQACQDNPDLAGIGFVFHESNGYMGVDFDYCMDEQGKLKPEVEQLLNGYTGMLEISPSGQGVKLITRGKKPEGITRCKKNGILGSKAVEWYDRARFFTVTGNSYNGSQEIVDGDLVSERLTQYFTTPSGEEPRFGRSNSTSPVQSPNKDMWDMVFTRDYPLPLYDSQEDERFDHSGEDFKYCVQLAERHLFDIDKIDQSFRESALMRDKWDSRRGLSTYGWNTIYRACEAVELDTYELQKAYINYKFEFRYDSVEKQVLISSRDRAVLYPLTDEDVNYMMTLIKRQGGDITAKTVREMIYMLIAPTLGDPVGPEIRVLENLLLRPKWFKPTDPLKEPVEPIDFIIDGFCARGSITTIGASPGAGKSILVQYLFSNQHTTLMKVKSGAKAVYLTGADASETEVRRRARSIRVNDGLYTVEPPEDLYCSMHNEYFVHSLRNEIKARKIDAIIFDTVSDYHEGSTYEAELVNKTMAIFRRLARETNCAVILITHTKKGSKIKDEYNVEDIADSRIFTSKSDFVFAIKSEYQDDYSNLIEIQNLKSRSAHPLPRIRAVIKMDDHIGLTVFCTSKKFKSELEQESKDHQKATRVIKAKELKKLGKSQREIADELGVSVGTVNKYLNEDKP